jgi:hypothetical protein
MRRSPRPKAGNATDVSWPHSCAPSGSNSSISPTLSRVTTMLRLKSGYRWAASTSTPRRTRAKVPTPRRASLVFGRAPSRLTCRKTGAGKAEEPADQRFVKQGAVGAHAGGYAPLVTISQEVEEVLPQEGLAAPEVHLEDLHTGKFIHQGPTGGRIQLFVTGRPQFGGKAVSTAQVADPRHLPGDVDPAPSAGYH